MMSEDNADCTNAKQVTKQAIANALENIEAERTCSGGGHEKIISPDGAAHDSRTGAGASGISVEAAPLGMYFMAIFP